MVLRIILICATVLVCTIFATLVNTKRRNRIRGEHLAADILAREAQLTDAIGNQPRATRNYMVAAALSWKDNVKEEYVFDAEKGVRIGRIPNMNDICIQVGTVSKEHCFLQWSEQGIILYDNDTPNGTYIKQGFSKVRVQRAAILPNNGVFFVEGIRFHARCFVYNTRGY